MWQLLLTIFVTMGVMGVWTTICGWLAFKALEFLDRHDQGFFLWLLVAFFLFGVWATGSAIVAALANTALGPLTA